MNFTQIESETHIITKAKALAEIKRENATRQTSYTRWAKERPLDAEKFAPQYRASAAIQQLLENITDKEYQKIMLRHHAIEAAKKAQTSLFPIN